MKETPADRLRQARIKADFKTMRLAAASLAVEYSTYAGHENGNRAMAIDDIILYCRRYHISADWLLTGNGRGPGGVEAPIVGDPAILSTLSRIRGLSEKDIDIAFGVIKNALDAKRAGSEQTLADGPLQPASLPHAKVP